jgi:lysophospholipase L1-like esterase
MFMYKIRIHCLGDSITEAAGLPECGRWTAILQALLDAICPDRFAVYNHGVGGNTSAMGLDRLKKPLIGKDITLIEFGLNDCSASGYNVKNRVGIEEFADNLRAMIQLVRKREGTPMLLTNPLPVYVNEARQGDGRLYSDKVREYNERIRFLSVQQDTALLDMEMLFAAPQWIGEPLRYDGLHLNEAGNRVYAEGVLRELKAQPDLMARPA